MKFDEHFRSFRRVPIAKFHHIVKPSLQSVLPISCSVAILDLLHSCRDVGKMSAVQIQIQSVSHRSDFSVEDSLQDVSMTMRLIFVAMAHEGNCLAPAKVLQEPERKLLTLVLNVWITLIDRASFEELFFVASLELRPTDLLGASKREKLLAWAKVSHPDMVSVLRQPTSANSCR